MTNFKKHLKNTFRKTAIILIVYILYRIVNIAAVNIIYDIRKDVMHETFQRDLSKRYCCDFEWPAPMINEVIDYDSLAWCHRCVVSYDEYEKNENYNLQIVKTNLSAIILPWTFGFDLFKSGNSENRHQYGTYNGRSYEIDMWLGYNVFTGELEEMVMFNFDVFFVLSFIEVVFILAAGIEFFTVILKKIRK